LDKTDKIIELKQHLNADFREQLVEQLNKMPINKVDAVLGFVESLRLVGSNFSIYKIVYSKADDKVSVDANFHLDSF
jgi:hypothetical protein